MDLGLGLGIGTSTTTTTHHRRHLLHHNLTTAAAAASTTAATSSTTTSPPQPHRPPGHAVFDETVSSTLSSFYSTWTMRTVNAVACGAKCELYVKGMLRLNFTDGPVR